MQDLWCWLYTKQPFIMQLQKIQTTYLNVRVFVRVCVSDHRDSSAWAWRGVARVRGACRVLTPTPSTCHLGPTPSFLPVSATTNDSCWGGPFILGYVKAYWLLHTVPGNKHTNSVFTHRGFLVSWRRLEASVTLIFLDMKRDPLKGVRCLYVYSQ